MDKILVAEDDESIREELTALVRANASFSSLASKLNVIRFIHVPLFYRSPFPPA